MERDIFERVQMLMDQRTREYDDNRNIPLRVGGKAMLSGNVIAAIAVDACLPLQPEKRTTLFQRAR